MVQREENSITNEVMARAWPNSMQSARFARGECLAACAVSQSARGSALGTRGKWKMDEMDEAEAAEVLCPGRDGFVWGVCQRPGQALFRRGV